MVTLITLKFLFDVTAFGLYFGSYGGSWALHDCQLFSPTASTESPRIVQRLDIPLFSLLCF